MKFPYSRDKQKILDASRKSKIGIHKWLRIRPTPDFSGRHWILSRQQGKIPVFSGKIIMNLEFYSWYDDEIITFLGMQGFKDYLPFFHWGAVSSGFTHSLFAGVQTEGKTWDMRNSATDPGVNEKKTEG